MLVHESGIIVVWVCILDNCAFWGNNPLECISGIGWVTDICVYVALAPISGLEDRIWGLTWCLVVIALKKRQTNFENNDVAWVKVMVMKTIIGDYAIPNIVDTECTEIFIMWLVVNDTLEPLE